MVDAALAIVVRLLAQGWRQSCLQLGGGDPLWPLFASDQLAQADGLAATGQFLAPLLVQPATFIEDEEHLEAGTLEQDVRRLFPGAAKSSWR